MSEPMYICSHAHECVMSDSTDCQHGNPHKHQSGCANEICETAKLDGGFYGYDDCECLLIEDKQSREKPGPSVRKIFFLGVK